jgi:Chlorophyll A-B binding protein
MATQPKSTASKSTASKSTAPLDPNAPGFGWRDYAERMNGRFAMVGFIALLALEFFTRQDFYTWLGLR